MAEEAIESIEKCSNDYPSFAADILHIFFLYKFLLSCYWFVDPSKFNFYGNSVKFELLLNDYQ